MKHRPAPQLHVTILGWRITGVGESGVPIVEIEMTARRRWINRRQRKRRALRLR